MANEFPNSYRDPLYASLDAKTEEKLGLPSGLLSSIRLNGEKSNNDQSPKETGARSPYQFIPATRKAILDKYGIDPLLSPENASEAAGLLLKEGLDRNKGDASAAVGEYIGGTDRSNWGRTTRAYIDRVVGNLPAQAPAAPRQSTFDRVSAQMDQQDKASSPMATVLQAYQSGQMSPEDAKTFEGEVKAGRVMLPRGVTLNAATASGLPAGASTSGPQALPAAVSAAYLGGRMTPEDRAKVDDLVKQGVVADPLKGAAAIPGQTEGAPSDVSKAVPDPTIGERIVGAGEAGLSLATGATTGMAGAVKGTVGGMFDPNVTNMQQLSDAAQKGAEAWTYAPRTESGQSQAAVASNVLLNAIPLAGMTGEMASAARAASTLKPTAAAIPTIARNTAATAAENVAAGIGKVVPDVLKAIPEKVGQMMGREPAQPRPTPGTMGSVGAAGVDMATQRRMAAQELPVPLDITEGMATREYGQQRFEKETAKHPELGAPLRERVQELNNGILRNFDTMVDLTGAESPDLHTTGTVVTDAIRTQLAKDKAKVRTAYKEAEKAGEMEAPVTLTSAIDHLNKEAPDMAVAPLLKAARDRMIQLGAAVEGPNGELIAQPVPLKTAELARRAISRAAGIDPTNQYHATLLRQAIDSATDGMGGNLYRAARAERTRLAQNYENHAAISDLIGTKRGTTDRTVALEDVFRRSILTGTRDGIRELRRVLHRSGPEGHQAWKELQGQTIKHIKDQATGSARDAAGNQTVSSHALNKTVTSLDNSGKLDVIFGKKDAETIRTLNDVVNAIRTSPEGVVNTSNTAAVLAGLVDVAFTTGSGGVPLPIASGIRLAVNNIKDRRIRAKVQSALNKPTLH